MTAYQRKYSREQLVALARQKGLYPREDSTAAERADFQARQDADRRKTRLRYAHLHPDKEE